jgi:hypothetical protein
MMAVRDMIKVANRSGRGWFPACDGAATKTGACGDRASEREGAHNRFCFVTSRLLFLAVLLPVAGCGPSSTPAPAPKPKETGYIARVQGLTTGQREGVLFRAIQAGGGQACQGIKLVESLPPQRPGQPSWRVTCDEGSQWLVSLADDGTALVTGARTG